MFWMQVAEHSSNLTKLSAREVIEHHVQCFRRGDIDGILSDYSDDALLFTPDGLIKGRESIAALFRRLLEEFQTPDATDAVRMAMFESNYACIIWSAETSKNIYEYAVDTFVIRQGKIVMQAFVTKIIAKQLPPMSL